MQEFIDIIVSNGTEIALVAYLVWRDKEYNSKLSQYMERTTTLMEKIFEFMDELRGGEQKDDA